MKKVPFTNTSDSFRNIGGVLIAPGSTRPVDARLLSGYGKTKPGQRPAKQHSDPILVLLDRKVPDIVPELPRLTSAQFDKLQQAERDGNKTRKTLKTAFDEEFARRAALEEDTGLDYDTFVQRLFVEQDELESLLAMEQENDNRERVIGAYQAEIDRRKAADAGSGED